MQSTQQRQAIVALGREMGPPTIAGITKTFDAEQRELVKQVPATAVNLAYGEHERQVLDIYSLENQQKNKPVIVFVHGGGFLKGDKGNEQNWYNSNVARVCAQKGYIGVAINYRLAPEFTWPSGGDDIALAVEWIKQNISHYGGDPASIILMGTSAGAVHVATFEQRYSEVSGIKGLLFLSGLYGITPLDDRDTLYYGAQQDYAQKHPLNALLQSKKPMFFVCSELDPQRFQQEFMGLIQRKLNSDTSLPRSMILSGHNHYSIAGHLGTSDTRLSDEMFSFIAQIV